MIKKAFSLLVFFAVVFFFILIGGYATGLSYTAATRFFSESLWGQPTWMVPPSWAFVYGLVAISGWLVWINTRGPERLFPMMLFSAILVCNAAWWWIFFEWQDPKLALMNLCLLWGLLFFAMAVFFLHSKIASGLLIPYMAWISYAIVFNYFKFIYQ